MEKLKRLVVDVDDTMAYTTSGDYANSVPNLELIENLQQYQNNGFTIILYTSRNMRTYEGSIGKINAHTLPLLISWLDKNSVPYDEIITGKPWCGFEGFYVDDKAVRPREFTNLKYEEIMELLERDK